MRAEERDFGWSKVKVNGLYLLWFDVKSVEGRKEGKDEKIKGEAIWPVSKKSEKNEVPLKVRTKYSFEELYEWEQAKRKEKNRENKRKLWEIHNEKESSEWKEKKSSFCSSYISKYCNLYLI